MNDTLTTAYADRALEWAAAFTPTPEQAEQIKTSLELQLAMQAHLYSAAVDSYRATCPINVVLPSYIENRLARAWDIHGAEFLAIARRELDAALTARRAA